MPLQEMSLESSIKNLNVKEIVTLIDVLLGNNYSAYEMNSTLSDIILEYHLDKINFKTIKEKLDSIKAEKRPLSDGIAGDVITLMIDKTYKDIDKDYHDAEVFKKELLSTLNIVGFSKRQKVANTLALTIAGMKNVFNVVQKKHLEQGSY